MFIIQQVTADPLQKQTLILPSGEKVDLTIEYKPLQFGWFIKSMVFGDWSIKGVRICTHPNLLHQNINEIPFGFACYSKANVEPTLQEDFLATTGRSTLYLLSHEEALALKGIFSGQTG